MPTSKNWKALILRAQLALSVFFPTTILAVFAEELDYRGFDDVPAFWWAQVIVLGSIWLAPLCVRWIIHGLEEPGRIEPTSDSHKRMPRNEDEAGTLLADLDLARAEAARHKRDADMLRNALHSRRLDTFKSHLMSAIFVATAAFLFGVYFGANH